MALPPFTYQIRSRKQIHAEGVPHSSRSERRGTTIINVYYVYILQLSDSSIYIGSAAELQRRLSDHTYGLVSSTKNLRPMQVRWFCAFPDKVTAMQFEKYLKSGSGFSWRKRHLGF